MHILAVNRLQASSCRCWGRILGSVFFITDVPANMQKDSAILLLQCREKIGKFSPKYGDRKKS